MPSDRRLTVAWHRRTAAFAAVPEENGRQIDAEILRHSALPVSCVMISDRLSRHASWLGIRHLLGKPFALAELQHWFDLSALKTR